MHYYGDNEALPICIGLNLCSTIYSAFCVDFFLINDCVHITYYVIDSNYRKSFFFLLSR